MMFYEGFRWTLRGIDKAAQAMWKCMGIPQSVVLSPGDCIHRLITVKPFLST